MPRARRVAPITAAAWPDPALVPLPGQPSAGTPSTRCWLPGRRRSPPPRGTSSQTGPARPAQVFPCAGGLWGGGHAARWPLRPRAQLQLSHFLTVGGGTGHGHPGDSAPHPCPSPDSVLAGSGWSTALGALASAPRAPSLPLTPSKLQPRGTGSPCSDALGVLAGGRAAVGEQLAVLGCRVSARGALQRYSSWPSL